MNTATHKKTLLMIHGIGATASVWQRMAALFTASGWHCVTPTLFPDKRTPTDPPDDLPALGFDDYVKAMQDELERLTDINGVKPVVIGHSMGGLIAQKLAERNAASAAIFLTPAQNDDYKPITPSMAITFGNMLLMGDKAARKKPQKIWKTGFCFGVLNAVEKSRHKAIYAKAVYDSGKVYGQIRDGIVIDETKVAIPTLTVCAGRDRTTIPGMVRKTGHKYQKAAVPGDYIEFPEHAHWIVDEAGTDQVVDTLISWLDKVSI